MSDDIEELLAREPFRQFVIVTSDGEEYIVSSPKQVTIPMHAETVHFAAYDYTNHVIAVRHILKLSFRTGAA